MQLPMFRPSCSWEPTPVSQLPSWAGAERVCVDLETRDPQLKKLGPGVRRDGKVAGIAFTIEDGPSHYLPIGHSEDNLDPAQVWAYIRDQMRAFRGWVVGSNFQYDLDYLWENKVEMPNIKGIRDIQVAEPLIDELQDEYNTDAIAARYGLPGKSETILRDAATAFGVDPKKGLYLLPGRYAAEYAMQDTRVPLQILRRQERRIEEAGLWKIFDLETKLLPVLVKMRRRGVRIDFDKLDEVEKWTIEQQHVALLKVKSETGISLALTDVTKPQALAKVLSHIGVECPTTPKTGQPSVSKELLASIKHPVGALLLRARKMDKLRNTFVSSVREHAVNGRIHTTFNQLRKSSDDEDEDDTGARYGRLSSTDPNLQQQPARDPEIGPFWRSIYVPDEGMLWAAMDYSQQEPRQVVHFAELCRLPVADVMGHKFRTDPKTDNHTEMARIIAGAGDDWKPDKTIRSHAKEIFLGLCYGMGGAKLCRKLGKPTEWVMSPRLGKMIEVAGPEGKAILEEFDRKVPYVRMLARLCEDKAKKEGVIKTLLGRHCHFPKKDDGTFDWTHKALNRLIQGSSADQTKLAVVMLDEAGWTPQLQIHDEIDDSVPTPEDAEKRADVMRHCVELKVPSKVDVEIGDSWGGSMK